MVKLASRCQHSLGLLLGALELKIAFVDSVWAHVARRLPSPRVLFVWFGLVFP